MMFVSIAMIKWSLSVMSYIFSVPVHLTWHHVAIDFIDPLPNSRSGNRFVLCN